MDDEISDHFTVDYSSILTHEKEIIIINVQVLT